MIFLGIISVLIFSIYGRSMIQLGH